MPIRLSDNYVGRGNEVALRAKKSGLFIAGVANISIFTHDVFCGGTVTGTATVGWLTLVLEKN